MPKDSKVTDNGWLSANKPLALLKRYIFPAHTHTASHVARLAVGERPPSLTWNHCLMTRLTSKYRPYLLGSEGCTRRATLSRVLTTHPSPHPFISTMQTPSSSLTPLLNRLPATQPGLTPPPSLSLSWARARKWHSLELVFIIVISAQWGWWAGGVEGRTPSALLHLL